MQEYTQEFRRRALLLVVYLQSQDTLLKYIGGLHSYLKHTILMFNPTSLDEVCVQATHLEARGKNITDESRNKNFKGKNKEKTSKGKGKKNACVKKEGEKVVCKHCSREGVIFPISHELIGIFIFVLLLFLKNKREKEVHISP